MCHYDNDDEERKAVLAPNQGKGEGAVFVIWRVMDPSYCIIKSIYGFNSYTIICFLFCIGYLSQVRGIYIFFFLSCSLNSPYK